MLARLLVAAACVVAVVVLAQRHADATACRDARTALFGAGLKGAAPSGLIARVRDHCDDPEDLALAAVGATRAHRAAAAASLARLAIHRAPDEFAGWAALATALQGRDTAGYAHAVRRARQLNPRWQPPAPAPDRAPAPAGGSGAAAAP